MRSRCHRSRLQLVGQANDYVGKGLSGGVVVVRPEAELLDRASSLPSPATPASTARPAGGSISSAGRASGSASATAGPRPSSRAPAPHACEYMTGGIAVILGPTGANLGAGMTGGRAYLWDPNGDRIAAANDRSIRWERLDVIAEEREDGIERVAELRRLMEAASRRRLGARA